MTLKLYFHPLSSFCQKVLVALYESDTPFEPHIVDLGDEKSRADFLKIWPVGQFPVLRDDAKGRTVPEFEHHHRVLGPELSGEDAPLARGRGPRMADTPARSLL